MTVDKFLEQIREGQLKDEEVPKKHLGSYRTKEVDLYIEKLLGRLQNMETLYQERFEEMRTDLLGATRERDVLSEKASALETKLQDISGLCEAYLRDKGLVTLEKETADRCRNIDFEELERLRTASEKQRLLEDEVNRLQNELELASGARKEADEALKMAEQLKAQNQDCQDRIETLTAQLQSQMEQMQEVQNKFEKMENLSQCQASELAQAVSKYQMLELQHQLSVEMNQQLGREKDCQEKEAVRKKELWEAERGFMIQRFYGIMQSQKQYMQHLQESVAASMQYIEKLSQVDFLETAAEDNYDKK